MGGLGWCASHVEEGWYSGSACFRWRMDLWALSFCFCLIIKIAGNRFPKFDWKSSENNTNHLSFKPTLTRIKFHGSYWITKICSACEAKFKKKNVQLSCWKKDHRLYGRTFVGRLIDGTPESFSQSLPCPGGLRDYRKTRKLVKYTLH